MSREKFLAKLVSNGRAGPLFYDFLTAIDQISRKSRLSTGLQPDDGRLGQVVRWLKMGQLELTPEEEVGAPTRAHLHTHARTTQHIGVHEGAGSHVDQTRAAGPHARGGGPELIHFPFALSLSPPFSLSLTLFLYLFLWLS